uniref:Radical SAM domain protein n=1 Tax=Nitratidesulfovibrio vulgaris (strain DSM 19637 / Miyazaki F) TaxID=883 RepID=B8DJ00_NITV9
MSCDSLGNYTIMPINFKYFDGKILVTTDHGDHLWMSQADFDALLRRAGIDSVHLYHSLKSKQMLSTDVATSVDISAAKIRSRKRFLYDFTSLHMLVTTVRCNQRCEYCQASCEDEDAHNYDMSVDVAEKIVDTIFKSPSPSIKIEFQGGEPTLNWKVIDFVVKYATRSNLRHNKKLDFVLCTNLTSISEDKLRFLADYNVYVSTSLDGPKDVHDFGRKLRCGESAYESFRSNLDRARSILGERHVDALMTTTKYSLGRSRDIVDEYLALGFNGLFLRALNPYGFAVEQRDRLGYTAEEFVDFYKESLEYIIYQNRRGIPVTEYYTSLLFSRMMTSQSTGFVDLQSPSGAGISGAIYDYNGDVYPADEARMLARMGDRTFCMGNVTRDSFGKIFGGPVVRDIASKSCLEVVPGCADCVYRPYCGADPIRNYLEHGDIIGKQPQSHFCAKNMKTFDHLFGLLLEADDFTLDTLWSWITPNSEGRRCEVV